MDLQLALNAVVLGIVEGLTEFLPVSSTGHLLIFNLWFGFPSESFTKTFDIVIQTGAILSVLVFFRKKLFPFYPSQSREEKKNTYDLWLKSIVGFLPAAVLGFLFNDLIDSYLMNALTVAVALLVWGVVLIALENGRVAKIRLGTLGPQKESVAELGLPLVLIIGLAQCLAMVPGTSRSAATIVAALLLGTSRSLAAEFSFFLAIPTLLGAGAYSFYKEFKGGLSLGGPELAYLGIGLAVSFAVAYLVIAAFMKFVSTRDFRPFGWYRVALGAGLLAAFSLGLFR